jgi:hypothetical protein
MRGVGHRRVRYGAGSTASHDGAFVWSAGAPQVSSVANKVTFGALGGFRVFAGGAGGAAIELDGPVVVPGAVSGATGVLYVEQGQCRRPGCRPGRSLGQERRAQRSDVHG